MWACAFSLQPIDFSTVKKTTMAESSINVLPTSSKFDIQTSSNEMLPGSPDRPSLLPKLIPPPRPSSPPRVTKSGIPTRTHVKEVKGERFALPATQKTPPSPKPRKVMNNAETVKESYGIALANVGLPNITSAPSPVFSGNNPFDEKVDSVECNFDSLLRSDKHVGAPVPPTSLPSRNLSVVTKNQHVVTQSSCVMMQSNSHSGNHIPFGECDEEEVELNGVDDKQQMSNNSASSLSEVFQSSISSAVQQLSQVSSKPVCSNVITSTSVMDSSSSTVESSSQKVSGGHRGSKIPRPSMSQLRNNLDIEEVESSGTCKDELAIVSFILLLVSDFPCAFPF